MEGTTVSIATNDPSSYNPYGSQVKPNQALILTLCQSPSVQAGATWQVDLPVPEATDASAAAASDSEPDMQKLLSQFGVSIEEMDISPEMLAEMAEAMSQGQSEEMGDSKEAQEKFIQTVNDISSGTPSPLADLTLLFQIALPNAENAAGNSDSYMEFDLD